MPILRVQCNVARYTPEQREGFMGEAAQLFADVLVSPVERIRVFLLDVPSGLCHVGGMSSPPVDPVFYEFYLLAGRPAEHKLRLMRGFTALLEQWLAADRSAIRGVCWHVPPDDWAIGERTAAELRSQEIADRARKQGHPSAE